MVAEMMLLAAAIVGGEWTDGSVRFETGNDAINRIVSAREKPSGAYGSKIVAVYENLRHTGDNAEVRGEWDALFAQVATAMSNQCDKAASSDSFVGACYWLLEARMMCELGPAAAGRGKHVWRYVPMSLKANDFIRRHFLADGALTPQLRANPVACAFAAYLGIVEGDALDSTCRALKTTLETKPTPVMGAFEWRVALDALSQNGMEDAAYSVLIAADDGAIDRGAALSWLWRTAAGIATDPTAPGFRNLIMAPKPDRRLKFLNAEYSLGKRVVKSSWRYDGGRWIWDFTVPAHSTASVTLPGESRTHHYDEGTHRIALPSEE